MKTDRYREHDRSDTWYTGEELDPVTGEYVRLPSMTKQSFAAECDINNILKQYKTHEQVNQLLAKSAEGVYADLPDENDFQEALNTVKQAESAFASLPSKLRSRFENDPGQFLDFMENPANLDEAIELGLIVQTRTPEPPVTAPAPQEPQAPSTPPGTPSP